MSCIETTKALVLSVAAAGSSGTVVGLVSTDTNFNMVTVFNESDNPVKVSYSTADGGGGNFIVPIGFVHTRKAHSVFIPNSVKAFSTNPSVAATGSITFNFGN